MRLQGVFRIPKFQNEKIIERGVFCLAARHLNLLPYASWIHDHFLVVCGDTCYTSPDTLGTLRDQVPFDIYYTVDELKQSTDTRFMLLQGLASPMFMPPCFMVGDTGSERPIDALVIQGAYEIKNWPLLIDVLMPPLGDLSWRVVCAGFGREKSHRSICSLVSSACSKYSHAFTHQRLISNEVADIMRRSKVLVLFSQNEGTSRVAAEAAACGCMVAIWSKTLTHTESACPPGRTARFDSPEQLRQIVQAWSPMPPSATDWVVRSYDFVNANDMLRSSVERIDGKPSLAWRYLTTEQNSHLVWFVTAEDILQFLREVVNYGLSIEGR